MTLKDLIAKLDECRAALEDDLVPEAKEACDNIDPEDEEKPESEALFDRLNDLEEALGLIGGALSYLEDNQ